MFTKKIRKSISYFLQWVGMSVSSALIRLFPMRYLYAIARLFAFVGYRLLKKQRLIALESLSLAFGKEKTPQEIEKISKECFTNIAKGGAEIIYLMDKPALLKSRVEIKGKENLDAALNRGKGIILVSAHFGNFPLLLAKLSLEGYNVNGIMRPMRNQLAEKFFKKKRVRLNIKTIYSIPRNTCVFTSIRALRNNEMLFIPLDQNFGTGGVFVNFFGHQAATATGPVVLALRTGAVILPCFISRNPDDTHVLVFDAPVELEETGDENETIRGAVQKITDIIELHIRRSPSEWGWIHRRWKTRPKQSSEENMF